MYVKKGCEDSDVWILIEWEMWMCRSEAYSGDMAKGDKHRGVNIGVSTHLVLLVDVHPKTKDDDTAAAGRSCVWVSSTGVPAAARCSHVRHPE